MDEREVRSKGSALQKAIAANEPKENIINILKDLQKNVKPTEDLLRATAIGKIVNRVKGMNNLGPEIPRLASEVVGKWKHTINASKGTSGASTPVPNGARSNGTQSPVPASKAPPKPAAATGVPPDKRNWKTDKVPRDDLTDDPSRNNCIGLMYDGLALNTTEPMTKVLESAKQVEKAALSLPESKDSSSSAFYKEKIRSLYQNLKNKSNPTLRTRILTGKISPATFVRMTHEELRSPEQREEDQRIAKENMDKAMVAQEEKSVSTHLECGKCKEKKVSYSQAQTRSADEPMTTFCECLVCGNRWKFS